jgi:hypothetical protein
MNNILSIIQESILTRLTSVEDLKEQLVGIFTHVPANCKFPYIHLGKIELKDRSSKTQTHYDAVINIGIYSRDRNYKSLFTMIDLLKNSLTINQMVMDGYSLFNLVCLSCEVDQKPDGLTSFANVKYRLSLGV